MNIKINPKFINILIRSEEAALPNAEIKGWLCTALRAQYGQPFAGSAVLDAQSRNTDPAEAEIRICFREAKYAATAPSAGPRSVQPRRTFKKPPFSS